jgi:hypothetical protein
MLTLFGKGDGDGPTRAGLVAGLGVDAANMAV